MTTAAILCFTNFLPSLVVIIDITQSLTWIILIPLGFPNSFTMHHGSFETTEKDKLILLSFPQILNHLVYPSTMVINLGECSACTKFNIMLFGCVHFQFRHKWSVFIDHKCLMPIIPTSVRSIIIVRKTHCFFCMK